MTFDVLPDEEIILKNPLGHEANGFMIMLYTGAKDAGVVGPEMMDYHEILKVKDWAVKSGCPYGGDTIMLVLGLWMGSYHGAVEIAGETAHRAAAIIPDVTGDDMRETNAEEITSLLKKIDVIETDEKWSEAVGAWLAKLLVDGHPELVVQVIRVCFAVVANGLAWDGANPPEYCSQEIALHAMNKAVEIFYESMKEQ